MTLQVGIWMLRMLPLQCASLLPLTVCAPTITTLAAALLAASGSRDR